MWQPLLPAPNYHAHHITLTPRFVPTLEIRTILMGPTLGAKYKTGNYTPRWGSYPRTPIHQPLVLYPLGYQGRQFAPDHTPWACPRNGPIFNSYTYKIIRGLEKRNSAALPTTPGKMIAPDLKNIELPFCVRLSVYYGVPINVTYV